MRIFKVIKSALRKKDVDENKDLAEYQANVNMLQAAHDARRYMKETKQIHYETERLKARMELDKMKHEQKMTLMEQQEELSQFYVEEPQEGEPPKTIQDKFLESMLPLLQTKLMQQYDITPQTKIEVEEPPKSEPVKKDKQLTLIQQEFIDTIKATDDETLTKLKKALNM